MVVYATREAERGLLSIMSTDGRFRMNLPSEQGEVREPAWAPNKFDSLETHNIKYLTLPLLAATLVLQAVCQP